MDRKDFCAEKIPGVFLALSWAVWLYCIKTSGWWICSVGREAGEPGSGIGLGDTTELATRLWHVPEPGRMGPAGAAEMGRSDALPVVWAALGQTPQHPFCQLTAGNPQQRPETPRSFRRHLSSLHSIFAKVVPFCCNVYYQSKAPSSFIFTF